MTLKGIPATAALIAMAAAMAAPALAEMPALAVSPDGATLMAAGDNRTLYTVDTATLQVSERRYVPEQIEWLDYSPDGRILFMRTDEEVFSAHSGGSLKTLYRVEDVDTLSYRPDLDRVAVMENNYKGGIVRLLVASTGEVLHRVELPEIKTSLIVLGDDGKSAIILTNYASSESEPKESTPSDLKGYPRYLHQQQHNGYVSNVVALNLETGAHSMAETFYHSGAPDLVAMQSGRMLLLNNNNDSALISADGATDLMDLGDDYISFSGLLGDGATMIKARNDEVGFYPLDGAKAGLATRMLEAGRLPGPGERVTAMDEAGDGTLYLLTDAYRLWKIAPGASEMEITPVF